MSALNPNVTIKFSGEGDQAISSANAVGAALDSLAVKSRNAQVGLRSVSLMLDDVSGKSAKVSSLGAAYQSAASGIVSTLNATRASAAAFSNMGTAADAARAKVVALNQAGGASVKSSGRAAPQSNKVSQNSGEFADVGPSIVGLGRMAVTTIGLTVGLAAVGQQVKSLISANMDLDAAMSAVSAVGNLDKQSEQYKELITLVEDLGSKTQYSAVQAAEGLKELVAGGYSAAQSAAMLGDTLNLAATENMAMGRASEIMVAGLQSFRLEADQSTRLADVLARAANASTASVDSLGEAFKFIAPVASALNVSLEDTAAVIALLSNNGVQAGMAGRGMGAIMSRMIAPAKDAQAVMKSFGVSLSEMNPAVVGLEGAMKSLAKIDTAGLVTLFGAENLDVASILKANAAGFSDMTGKINDLTVSAEKMQKFKNDNLTGDFKKLAAAILGVKTELGGDMYAEIRVHAQSFTKYVQDNRDAIISNVKEVAGLAKVLIPIAQAYVAIKAVKFTASLLESISKWGLETAAVKVNTAALTENAAARTVGKGKGKIGALVTGGVALGAVAGYQSADEDASVGEKIGRTIGGAAVVGTAGKALEMAGTKATQLIGAGMAAGTPGLVVAAKTVMATAAAVLTFPVVATAAVAGGVYAVADAYVHAGKNADNAILSTIELGDAIADAARQSIDSATGDAELGARQMGIRDQIIYQEKQLADMKANGEDQGVIDSAQTTLGWLKQILKGSQDQFNANQLILGAKKQEEFYTELAAETEKKRAAALGEASIKAANLLESSKELSASLPDFGKKLIDAMPDAEALDLFAGQEAKAVASVKKIRGAMEAILSKGGADMSLIDTNSSIKDANDVAAYTQRVMALALRNDGPGKNLTGSTELASLKKYTEDALAAKNSKDGKQNSEQARIDGEKRVTQEIAGIEADIAINREKAAGNTAEVKKLEREKALLAEKVKLQALLTKDIVKGSPNEDKERKVAVAKADDLAERSVNAKFAAENKGGGGRAVTLGSAAQGINSFFGRSANAGMIEEAKKHTDLLYAIRDVLSDKTRNKTEISVRPVWAGVG